MSEIITDEFLDEMYEKYRFYVRICESSGAQALFTFEEYVVRALKFREFRMNKLKERGLHVGKE